MLTVFLLLNIITLNDKEPVVLVIIFQKSVHNSFIYIVGLYIFKK